MKKKAQKQLSLKNWKKLKNFLIFQKHINPKKNSLQPIGHPDARKNNRQVKIGRET